MSILKATLNTLSIRVAKVYRTFLVLSIESLVVALTVLVITNLCTIWSLIHKVLTGVGTSRQPNLTIAETVMIVSTSISLRSP